MSDFSLNGSPVSNNSHPIHRLFCQCSRSAKITQSVFSILKRNPDNQYSIKDLASQCGCGYFAAYRACRNLVSIGSATYVAIEWPTVTKRGLESIAHRVGVRYCDWFKKIGLRAIRIGGVKARLKQRKLKRQECNEAELAL